jgi:hypothetical protein
MNKQTDSLNEGIIGGIKNMASHTVNKAVGQMKSTTKDYVTGGSYRVVKPFVKAAYKNAEKKRASSSSLQQRAGRTRAIHTESIDLSIFSEDELKLFQQIIDEAK